MAPGSSLPAAEAQRRYRQVMDSGDAFAIHELGVLAHAQGRDDIAVEAIGKAIALNSEVASFHYNHALALRGLGRLEEAAAAYRRALALRPDHAEAHNNLGNVLAALGRREEALDCFARTLSLKPGFVQGHYGLANLLCELGRREEAVTHLRACLAGDPADSLGAGMLLARLGAEPVPQRASAAQLESLYARRAFDWDREPDYRGPALVAEALRKFAPAGSRDILDAGCGTGLLGGLVRDLARRLDGVDLSAAMLERAAEKRVYDRLVREEMLDFMAASVHHYDVVASAATLIHFGDLGPVFGAAATALKPGGLFAFTLFPNEGAADFAVAQNAELAKNACYVHRPEYVERLARQAGFGVEMLAPAQHERDRGGAPLAALVAVLRRGPADA